MSYGSKKPPTVARNGLSVLRRGFGNSPEAISFAKRLANNASDVGDRTIIRPFAPSAEHDIPQASLRLCHSAETRRRLANARLSKEHNAIGFMVSELLRRVPGLQDEVPITFDSVRDGQSGGSRRLIALQPDDAGRELLRAERRAVLEALEDAAQLRRTEWGEEPFELIVVTTSEATRQRDLRSMINLVMSHCPLELTLGPVGFEPRPPSE